MAPLEMLLFVAAVIISNLCILAVFLDNKKDSNVS